jgi:hypothetical protein
VAVTLLTSIAFISVSNVIGQGKGDFGLFWQVGHQIVIGDIRPIYSTASQAIDISQIQPSLAFFWYPPHLAAACMPLGLLSLKASMVAFKAIQTAALLAAALLFISSLIAPENQAKAKLIRFLPLPLFATFITAITFMPISLTIALCQPGIIIGFLPVTAAYRAMLKGRQLLAGITLGVLVNKPQFLLPFALLAIACLMASIKTREQKEYQFVTTGDMVKVAIGFAITTAGCGILGLSVFGLDGYLLWLQRLKSSLDFVYAHTGFTGYKEPFELISSLTMAIAFQCQQIPTVVLKNTASAFLFAVSLGELFLLYRIASSSISKRNKTDALLVTTLLSYPVISPYFRIYDLSLVLLSAWIILLGSPSSEKTTRNRTKLLTIFFLLFVDIRCLIIPIELAHNLTWINLVFVTGITIYSLTVSLLLQPSKTEFLRPEKIHSNQ